MLSIEEGGGAMHELAKQVADYKSLKRTISDLEEKLKVIEDEIKGYMGDAEELSVDGDTVRWKRYEQSRFDTTGFREQHPALYEQFVKKLETRRFTIT